MEKRIFAKTGDEISLLGFGVMRLPVLEENDANIDIPAARALIDRALEAGVNYFDTAFPYHGGASEKFLGQALSHLPRDSYYLATKMPPWQLKSTEDLHSIFEKQLERLQVDYFDFYLIHNVSVEHLAIFERFGAYEFLREKQAQGKLRHLGFSFHDRPALLKEMVERHPWDFVQIQLNYLDWEDQNAKEQYEILAERNIPVIVMEPVRGGALAALPEASETVLRQVNPEASTASWAIRFAAQLPGVLTVLSGMSNAEQLEDNIATLSPLVPLSRLEQQAVEQATELYRKNATVPCTACRYCIPCPYGVDIPKVFAVYNHYKNNKSGESLAVGCRMLAETGPESCVACGVCVEKCPQNIAIPEEMATIAQTVRALP